MCQHMTRQQYESAIESGPYAWPGGYPVRFIMSDGESVCFDCGKAESAEIGAAIAAPVNGDSWLPIACEVYWEGAPETCAHCSAEIESAYGDPESE
jgi:hypothetical protein